MAGIGFELKKLFKGKGLLQGMQACFFSMLITVGPTFLCIVMLTILQKLLYGWGVPVIQRELFMAAVTYSFIFSLILTSGLTIILSRYISDKIYKSEYEDILPSLKGAVTLCVIIGGIIGTIFYFRSPLSPVFRLAAYALFMELNILWLQTVYVSALKDYMKLVKGFFIGIVSVFFLAYVLVGALKVDAVTGVLASVDAGFFVIILFFTDSIQSFFRKSSKRYFVFLEYFDRYPALFFIGLFYTLGLFVHNFVFWVSDCRVMIGRTYVFSPVYDVPAFWAFLSVMPAMAIFVVYCETSFYEKYKAYYDSICNGGLIHDIIRLENEMREVLSHSLRNVMGIQMVITVFCLVAGMVYLPLSGLEDTCIDIFNVLVIGDYAFIVMFICLTVLLYFDDRKGALSVVCIFVLSNVQFTCITVSMGENFYGLGFMAAAFLSLAIAFIRLNYFFKNIRYFTFCSQPIIQQENEKVFTWICRKMQDALGEHQG